MVRTSHITKLDIVRLHRNSYTTRDIRAALNSKGIKVTRQVIDYWVQQYRLGKFTDEITCPSATKVKTMKTLTRADVQFVKRTLSSEPCTSSRTLHKRLLLKGSKVSLSTTKRAIVHAGFTCTKPRYCQMVRHVNKEKRVAFCKMLVENNDQFNDMIFSDECTVQLHQNKVYIYRRYDQVRPSLPKPKHPLKVHVWAGISKRGATPILIFDGIMNGQFFTDHILRDTFLPYVRRKFPDQHRFQMDNDPKHRSKVSKDFMTANGINWWDVWPSESADLNPIEMVWSQLKRHLSTINMTTKEELVNNIRLFWSTYMTKLQCTTYIDHVYKVVPVCILMKGQATGSIPNKIFKEPSHGKTISYFQTLLWSPSYDDVRKKTWLLKTTRRI
ncbi:Hypothetical predicted protein [Mytilus galloprovincialis]|uniref:Tc1-like transposase DDE domain-containing protein n=1 Tax=Mytilus galloprovincialis TaxID=29158 RepID=A0A8B6FJ13_MYTGA|nr:Hypothetical predicted protein [Mytilus galloprovincialis]